MNTTIKGKDEFHYTEKNRGSIIDLFSEQELEAMGLIISKETRERLEREEQKKIERERQLEEWRIESQKRQEEIEAERLRKEEAERKAKEEREYRERNLPDEVFAYREVSSRLPQRMPFSLPADIEGHNELVKGTRSSRLLAEAFYKDSLAKIPDRWFIPSSKEYRDSFSCEANDHAYMQLVEGIEEIDLRFENGVLYIGNNPKMGVRLKYTKEGYESLNIPLLRSIYSIIWFNLEKDLPKLFSEAKPEEQYLLKKALDDRNCDSVNRYIALDRFSRQRLFSYGKYVYIPDLMRYLGLHDPSKEQINSVIAEIKRFGSVHGIMTLHCRDLKGHMLAYGQDCPVIIWNDNYELTDSIFLQSPYINNIIKEMIMAKTQLTDYKGRPKFDRKGKPIYIPNTLTTKIDPRIASAKNKRAVELLVELAIYLDTSGPKKSIKPVTLMKVGTEFRAAYDYEVTTRRKNEILKRAFSTMWEYADKYSDLSERYVLPRVIPTKDTLEKAMDIEKRPKNKK